MGREGGEVLGPGAGCGGPGAGAGVTVTWPTTPVGGRGVKITVPAHIALALASQQTRLQELGLLAQGEGLSELWGLGTDATHSHSHRVPLRRGAGRRWSGERESETSARLAPSLTPDGSGWLWRATGLPVTRVYAPGTLACG